MKDFLRDVAIAIALGVAMGVLLVQAMSRLSP